MSVNYKSHALKLYGDDDTHYLNLRDGANTVSGFGSGQKIHEMRYTDVASGLENQPIMIRGLHVDIGGQTTGVGYKLGDLQTQVSDEVSGRQSAISSVQGSIDSLSATVDTNRSDSDASLATLTSDLSDLSDLVASNNTANGSAVSDEASARASADSALSDRLTYLEGVIAALLQ